MAFQNEAWRAFSDERNQDLINEDLMNLSKKLGRSYPLVIGGRQAFTAQSTSSHNPSDPGEVIGEVSSAEKQHAEHAIKAAREAFKSWRFVGPEQRAEYLFHVARQMRAAKVRLTSLIIKEAGKNRVEADADVCEAIDFLEFYGHEMIRVGAPYKTQDYPGEINTVQYIPRGVAAVIAPWNFPLAILTGMTAAALVTGNTVVMKPASQTPVIGYYLMDMFIKSGLPEGVLNYLPGPGEVVGEYLVTHPAVSLVAFTGSMQAGLRIVNLASQAKEGQSGVKRVIGEFGGKNGVIVDETAVLEDAASGISASAFGYSGQKCSAASRVIALEPVYNEVLERLLDHAKNIRIGRAEDQDTYIGPLISKEQLEKVKRYIEIGKSEATLALEIEPPQLHGWFAGPVIFSNVKPDARIAQEEIFGPVVAVIKARNMDEALAIANSTKYGLTAGIYSRTEENIARFKREIDAGNRYINRKITGSIVERQPFGGYKMSGVGSKAGGRDYLPQFMIPVSIAERIVE